jgi:flagellar biosynthetic protein FliP
VIGSGLLSLAGALAVTLGLLGLALRLLGRLHGSGARRRIRVPLEVLQRLSVGPKQGVVLLRVADRVLVVSMTESGTQLLTELDGVARDHALAPLTEGPSRRGWSGVPLLSRFGLLLALTVLPVGASPAQTVPPVRTPSLQPAASSLVQGPGLPQVEVRLGQGADGLHLSGTVGLVVFLGVLTLLPALFLLMTSFTRILIVLQFLRSALGTQATPPNQLLVAVAVLLTGIVMNPVLQDANRTALQPYFAGQIPQTEAYRRAVQPFREFMLANTREQDLNTFASLSGATPVDSIEQLPTVTVVSAFVSSELRTAFQMGFVIFLPFVVVDLIVASVLMSMGMFMLPPMMISLPFKLLLFVLADGWTLVVQSLVASFR